MTVAELKPDRPLLLSHLPKRLREKPALRALTLRVIEQGAHYVVSGRTRNYLVTGFRGALQCDCIAAQSGTTCAHLLAAISYHERKTGVKLAPSRPVASSGEGDYKQPVRLQRGLYGGMFARYTAPKQYAKFQSQETEEKFFVTFLITHDAAGRELPQFSEAFCGVRTKMFYDPATEMMSTLCAFYVALLKGKMGFDEIVNASDDELPDLNDLIGFPAQLFIDPAMKPDKNGIYINKIDTGRGGFDPPNTDLKKSVRKLYAEKEIGTTDDGRVYLKKPAAVFEDQNSGQVFTPSTNGNDDELDELPF